MPRISVVMATYQGETYLREMLESLAAQTRRPDELVVRDDASDDRTVAIVRDFAARAPFSVQVLADGTRLGYAQNFVAATAASSGDLVLFADQDDVWHADKLAVLEAEADC